MASSQVDEQSAVIRTKRAKQRGKKHGEVIELVEITPALAGLIEGLKAARKNDYLYVFPNRYGTHYTQAGFKASSLAEWTEIPSGIKAQIMGHKPSAIAERHYNVRPLDLLRMWHDKLEAWTLKEAHIDFKPEQSQQGLQAVSQ